MTNMRSGYRSLSLKALKVLKLYSGEVAHRSYFQVMYHLLFFFRYEVSFDVKDGRLKAPFGRRCHSL